MDGRADALKGSGIDRNLFATFDVHLDRHIRAVFATPAISDSDARQIGIDGYVYLYPLISMDVTRRVSTNVEAGKKPGLRLAGAFQHFRKFPTAEFREVVRPNFDMPYWLAWFDVSKEPNPNTQCTARRPKQSAAREHPLELPHP